MATAVVATWVAMMAVWYRWLPEPVEHLLDLALIASLMWVIFKGFKHGGSQ